MRVLSAFVLVAGSLGLVGCTGPGGVRGLHSEAAGSVCTADHECETGLVCDQLHCAALCTRSSECARLGSAAYCTTHGTCGQRCETTAECAAEHDCRGGTCVAQPVPL